MKWLSLWCLASSYFIFIRLVEGGNCTKFPISKSQAVWNWLWLCLCAIPQNHTTPQALQGRVITNIKTEML